MIFRSGSGYPLSQPTWVDRQGNNQGVVGKPGIYYRLANSPDGNYAAASRKTTDLSSADVWILDLLPGTERLLTNESIGSYFPIWSHDSAYVIYGASGGKFLDLNQQAISGIEQEKLLFESSYHKHPTSWSSDGRFVLYNAEKGTTRNDLYMFSLEDDKETPIMDSEFNEGDGQFSPDMKWIAYVSNASGTYEVYVRPFSMNFDKTSSTTGNIQVVAKSGGIGPR